MSSPLANKRRRLLQSAAEVNKPFRSPLRTPRTPVPTPTLDVAFAVKLSPALNSADDRLHREPGAPNVPLPEEHEVHDDNVTMVNRKRKSELGLQPGHLPENEASTSGGPSLWSMSAGVPAPARHLAANEDSAGAAEVAVKPRPSVSKGFTPSASSGSASPAIDCATPAHGPAALAGIVTRASPHKDSISELQSRGIACEGRLRALRNDIDTLKQATAIETGGKDDQLALLTSKWRETSRAAAEEVFASCRDRVNRMGGVGAWREQENERRRNFEFCWGSDDRRVDGDVFRGEVVDDDGGVAQGEQFSALETEDESSGTDDRVEGFSMAMMLRSLNVDLSLIGYDPEAERWTED